ncbi:transglutaminase family protein [Myxococcota bacterium]
MTDELSTYLAPTEFIESEAPQVKALATSLKKSTTQETAIALFYWVRDQIRYDVRTSADGREMYRATAIIERGSGYCVQKAVLLAALGRAAGIPTRLGFADVRNHKIPERMLDFMGTDLFAFHGYVEFHLAGQWVKATPAFDQETSRRAGALLVELDGTHDAMLHPVDPEGHPHIEYIRNRGSFADLPLEELQQTFREVYGLRVES